MSHIIYERLWQRPLEHGPELTSEAPPQPRSDVQPDQGQHPQCQQLRVRRVGDVPELDRVAAGWNRACDEAGGDHLRLYLDSIDKNLPARLKRRLEHHHSRAVGDDFGRAISNYLSYFSPQFLFTHGSDNLRLHTGFGGMLLLVTAPAVVAGVVYCIRNLRDPMCRFVVLATVVAPIPAALTAEGTPHPGRSSTMIPFVLLLAAYGWRLLWPELLRRRALLAALGLFAVIECAGYFIDLYSAFPARSALWFEAGQQAAIHHAHEAAGGSPVVISSSFGLGYIQADFALLPAPAATTDQALGSVGASVLSPQQMSAAPPGALLVLAPGDSPPPGAVLVETETITLNSPYADVNRPPQEQVPATIWER